MIRSYRSYHFFLWRILGAIIPLTFVYAVLVRPASIRQDKNAKTELKVNVVQQSASTFTIEVIISGSIPGPSCIARQIAVDTTVLGQINHAGKYVFIIPKMNDPSIIELYNPVQDVIIESFKLSQQMPTTSNR
ncbi:MAG: hypothetical protein ABIS36_15705 [Chryseolinea sp.]